MAKHWKGFTLIELMIVMAIIAMASAIIIPRIGSSDGKLFRVQLQSLLATLNYNRRSAIVLNRPVEMTLFPFHKKDEDNTFVIAKGDWSSQGANIQWSSGTQIIRNAVFKIKYYPQGGATGGSIRLQHGAYIASLIIDGITGKMTLKEFKNNEDN